MRRLFAIVTLLCASILLALNVYAANSADAEAVVKDTTNKVLDALKSSSNQEVYTLVEKVVSPHFNFPKMSRLVLKRRNWRRASEEEKEDFVKAFRGLLVCTYTKALTDAGAGKVHKINYSTVANRPRKTIISANVYPTGKNQVLKVNYVMSYFSKWQVYNVIVGDVNLVAHYRTQFAKYLKNKDIEDLIQKIQTQNHT
mgnify:FL=1